MVWTFLTMQGRHVVSIISLIGLLRGFIPQNGSLFCLFYLSVMIVLN